MRAVLRVVCLLLLVPVGLDCVGPQVKTVILAVTVGGLLVGFFRSEDSGNES
jgi:hypothetical protein